MSISIILILITVPFISRGLIRRQKERIEGHRSCLTDEDCVCYNGCGCINKKYAKTNPICIQIVQPCREGKEICKCINGTCKSVPVATPEEKIFPSLLEMEGIIQVQINTAVPPNPVLDNLLTSRGVILYSTSLPSGRAYIGTVHFDNLTKVAELPQVVYILPRPIKKPKARSHYLTDSESTTTETDGGKQTAEGTTINASESGEECYPESKQFLEDLILGIVCLILGITAVPLGFIGWGSAMLGIPVFTS